MVMAIAVLIAIAIVTLVACNAGAERTGTDQSAPSNSGSTGSIGFMGSVSIEIDTSFGVASPVVVGSIRNSSDEYLDYVQVTCELYQGDIQVASAMDNTSGLSPGKTWPFRAQAFTTDSLPTSGLTADCSGSWF